MKKFHNLTDWAWQSVVNKNAKFLYFSTSEENMKFVLLEATYVGQASVVEDEHGGSWQSMDWRTKRNNKAGEMTFNLSNLQRLANSECFLVCEAMSEVHSFRPDPAPSCIHSRLAIEPSRFLTYSKLEWRCREQIQRGMREERMMSLGYLSSSLPSPCRVLLRMLWR